MQKLQEQEWTQEAVREAHAYAARKKWVSLFDFSLRCILQICAWWHCMFSLMRLGPLFLVLCPAAFVFQFQALPWMFYTCSKPFFDVLFFRFLVIERAEWGNVIFRCYFSFYCQRFPHFAQLYIYFFFFPFAFDRNFVLRFIVLLRWVSLFRSNRVCFSLENHFLFLCVYRLFKTRFWQLCASSYVWGSDDIPCLILFESFFTWKLSRVRLPIIGACPELAFVPIPQVASLQ